VLGFGRWLFSVAKPEPGLRAITVLIRRGYKVKRHNARKTIAKKISLFRYSARNPALVILLVMVPTRLHIHPNQPQ
jgi:hypothetical protein